MLCYKPYSDQELVSLLKNGDEYAFAEVFYRYNSLLLNFAYKRIKDKDEAKDIVQEVFLKLWDNRKDLEIRSNIRSYLYRAVFNRILNVFKHSCIREEYVLSLQQKLEETSNETDYLIREKDLELLIQNEISCLPPKMREVFEMRKVEYLSNKQIAEKLGITEQTVATHMKRALRVLRVRLGIISVLIAAALCIAAL